MSNTAQITINVTTFVANGSATPVAPFCEISAPTIPNGPGNSGPQNASDQVGIDPDDATMIWVNRKNSAAAPIKLVFTMGGDDTYRPQQILFNQTFAGADPNAADPDGSKNFKDRKPSGQSISFKDEWAAKGKKNAPGGSTAPRWKYFIQIKNSSGTAGWIDPGVENADDL